MHSEATQPKIEIGQSYHQVKQIHGEHIRKLPKWPNCPYQVKEVLEVTKAPQKSFLWAHTRKSPDRKTIIDTCVSIEDSCVWAESLILVLVSVYCAQKEFFYNGCRRVSTGRCNEWFFCRAKRWWTYFRLWSGFRNKLSLSIRIRERSGLRDIGGSKSLSTIL